MDVFFSKNPDMNYIPIKLTGVKKMKINYIEEKINAFKVWK